MTRLLVWTIVLDLCISAEADRPAPAVVHRLRTLDRSGTAMFIPTLAHIRCGIGGTTRLVRSIQLISSALSIDTSSASGAVRIENRDSHVMVIRARTHKSYLLVIP